MKRSYILNWPVFLCDASLIPKSYRCHPIVEISSAAHSHRVDLKRDLNVFRSCDMIASNKTLSTREIRRI